MPEQNEKTEKSWVLALVSIASCMVAPPVCRWSPQSPACGCPAAARHRQMQPLSYAARRRAFLR